MIVVAGILLLLPGFLTDIVGMALLIPVVRSFIWAQIGRRIVVVRSGAGANTGTGFRYESPEPSRNTSDKNKSGTGCRSRRGRLPPQSRSVFAEPFRTQLFLPLGRAEERRELNPSPRSNAEYQAVEFTLKTHIGRRFGIWP